MVMRFILLVIILLSGSIPLYAGPKPQYNSFEDALEQAIWNSDYIIECNVDNNDNVDIKDIWKRAEENISFDEINDNEILITSIKKVKSLNKFKNNFRILLFVSKAKKNDLKIKYSYFHFKSSPVVVFFNNNNAIAFDGRDLKPVKLVDDKTMKNHVFYILGLQKKYVNIFIADEYGKIDLDLKVKKLTNLISCSPPGFLRKSIYIEISQIGGNIAIQSLLALLKNKHLMDDHAELISIISYLLDNPNVDANLKDKFEKILCEIINEEMEFWKSNPDYYNALTTIKLKPLKKASMHLVRLNLALQKIAEIKQMDASTKITLMNLQKFCQKYTLVDDQTGCTKNIDIALDKNPIDGTSVRKMRPNR